MFCSGNWKFHSFWSVCVRASHFILTQQYYVQSISDTTSKRSGNATAKIPWRCGSSNGSDVVRWRCDASDNRSGSVATVFCEICIFSACSAKRIQCGRRRTIPTVSAATRETISGGTVQWHRFPVDNNPVGTTEPKRFEHESGSLRQRRRHTRMIK